MLLLEDALPGVKVVDEGIVTVFFLVGISSTRIGGVDTMAGSPEISCGLLLVSSWKDNVAYVN